MPIFLSTFAPGFSSVIRREIPRDIPGASILDCMDGAVQYRVKNRTFSPPAYLHTTYLCLSTFPKAKGESPVRYMIDRTLHMGIDQETAASFFPDNARTFRVLVNIEGSMTGLSSKQAQDINEYITSTTGLQFHGGRPDVEFYYLYRQEGVGYFLMKLKGRRQEQGISSDLLQLIVKTAEIQKNDKVANPLSGDSALNDILQGIYQIDFIEGSINKQTAAPTPGAETVLWSQDHIPSQITGCDAIVTRLMPDKGTADLDTYYRTMFSCFHRMLASGATMTVLTYSHKQALRHLDLFTDVQTISTASKGSKYMVIQGRKR